MTTNFNLKPISNVSVNIQWGAIWFLPKPFFHKRVGVQLQASFYFKPWYVTFCLLHMYPVLIPYRIGPLLYPEQCVKIHSIAVLGWLTLLHCMSCILHPCYVLTNHNRASVPPSSTISSFNPSPPVTWWQPIPAPPSGSTNDCRINHARGITISALPGSGFRTTSGHARAERRPFPTSVSNSASSSQPVAKDIYILINPYMVWIWSTLFSFKLSAHDSCSHLAELLKFMTLLPHSFGSGLTSCKICLTILNFINCFSLQQSPLPPFIIETIPSHSGFKSTKSSPHILPPMGWSFLDTICSAPLNITIRHPGFFFVLETRITMVKSSVHLF